MESNPHYRHRYDSNDPRNMMQRTLLCGCKIVHINFSCAHEFARTESCIDIEDNHNAIDHSPEEIRLSWQHPCAECLMIQDEQSRSSAEAAMMDLSGADNYNKNPSIDAMDHLREDILPALRYDTTSPDTVTYDVRWRTNIESENGTMNSDPLFELLSSEVMRTLTEVERTREATDQMNNGRVCRDEESRNNHVLRTQLQDTTSTLSTDDVSTDHPFQGLQSLGRHHANAQLLNPTRLPITPEADKTWHDSSSETYCNDTSGTPNDNKSRSMTVTSRAGKHRQSFFPSSEGCARVPLITVNPNAPVKQNNRLQPSKRTKRDFKSLLRRTILALTKKTATRKSSISQTDRSQAQFPTRLPRILSSRAQERYNERKADALRTEMLRRKRAEREEESLI